MRRRRIIIELDLAPNTDINHWHKGLVPLMHNTLDNVVYIATEDVKEPDVISGFRNPTKR